MKYILGFMVLISTACLSFDVRAGFQFTAPIEQTPQAQIAPINKPIQKMPAVPSIKVQRTPVESVVARQPRPTIQSTPQPRMPVIQAESPSTDTRQPVMANESTLAVGFGKNLPLATALKQVIPDGYTYVMDSDVSIGENVSWNGGQPWPVVLNNMVATMGLASSVDGKIVRITDPSPQKNLAQSPVSWEAKAELKPSAPVQLASASNYNQSNTMSDASPSHVRANMDATVERRNSVVSMPWEKEPIQTAPTNILGPQLKSEFVTLQSTEPEAVKKLEESIVPDVTQGQWMAQNGSSLKTVLESWANLEGVDLFWSAEYDYTLAGDANISGNFEEAVEILLEGFSGAKPKPTGRLHPNLPHGPAVLVIETTQLDS